jgi:MarR family
MTRWDVERAVMASELPPSARLAMFVLLAKTDSKTAVIPAEHTPSLTVLAGATGLDRSTIARTLRQLERDDWVSRQRPPVEQSRRGARTRYRLTVPSGMTPLPSGTTQLGVVAPDRKPSRTVQPRIRPSPILTAIGDELHRATGKTYDVDWCAKVEKTIFNGQAVGNREAYARKCIRTNPERYIPTNQPPPIREVLP